VSALVVSGDLFSTSKLVGDAKAAGCPLSIVANPADAPPRVTSVSATLVVIDLANVKADLAELVAQLRAAASQPISIIAYGPHVHEDRLQIARNAGCDQVLARGQFLANAQAFFRSALDPS
jgi:CheY-like chemotaxis protein